MVARAISCSSRSFAIRRLKTSTKGSRATCTQETRRDTPVAGQRSMIQSGQSVSTYKTNISVRTTVRGAQRLSSRVRSNGNTSWRGPVSLFRLSWLRAFIRTALLPLGSGSRPKGRGSKSNGGRYGKFYFEMGRADRRIVGSSKESRVPRCESVSRVASASSCPLIGSSNSSLNSAGDKRFSSYCVMLDIDRSCLFQTSYQSITLGSLYFKGPVRNAN
jgi:hypothetical protein